MTRCRLCEETFEDMAEAVTYTHDYHSDMLDELFLSEYMSDAEKDFLEQFTDNVEE